MRALPAGGLRPLPPGSSPQWRRKHRRTLGRTLPGFSVPLEEFYEGRYIKIGQTKRDIDRIADAMVNTFARMRMFPDIGPIIRIALAAKIKCETLRTDPDIFDAWGNFATAAERLVGSPPVLSAAPNYRRSAWPTAPASSSGRAGLDLPHNPGAGSPCPRAPPTTSERCVQFATTGSALDQWIPLPA